MKKKFRKALIPIIIWICVGWIGGIVWMILLITYFWNDILGDPITTFYFISPCCLYGVIWVVLLLVSGWYMHTHPLNPRGKKELSKTPPKKIEDS